MNNVSLKEISNCYGRPKTTTFNHIKKLITDGSFVKKSPGKRFNEEEVRELEELLCFKFDRSKSKQK